MDLLPVLAEATTSGGYGFAYLGAGVGAGLSIIGGGVGIGLLGGSTVEAQARQPEMGGRIFTTMIIAAALIEGVTFFALVICFLIFNNVEKLLKLVESFGH